MPASASSVGGPFDTVTIPFPPSSATSTGSAERSANLTVALPSASSLLIQSLSKMPIISSGSDA